MRDVASRLDNRVHMTTDGLNSYIVAVDRAFEGEFDYAQIVKMYGPDPTQDQRRPLPAICTSIERHAVMGNHDPAHVSTSFARPHKTRRNPYPRTPAMAASVADHVWTLAEIAALLD